MSPILNIYNSNLSKLIQLNILEQYQQIVIVTDDIVYDLYYEHINYIKTYCKTKGTQLIVYKIPNGEKSKNLQTKISIENFMFENNIKRTKSVCIALGGGVVGDLTGFVASTYKRGIEFIQIPTTILAMVDSSIGGKTGINNQYGKNLIGSFYQAKYILLFTDFIKTLPREEIINGFAEIIKTAIINNIQLWNILKNNTLTTVLNNTILLEKIIYMTATEKMKIVKDDIHDLSVSKGKKLVCPREHLNFGHTVGHIIEYSQKLKHGYAVAVGMVLELSIKEDNKYIIPIQIRNELCECLRNYELPTEIDEKISVTDIKKYLKHDKKDGRIVLINEIGTSYTRTCTLNQIIECINKERQISHKNNTEPIIFYGPGSKSETNRVLILASLGEGICTIKNALLSDDTVYMIKALQLLGVKITIKNNDIIVVGNNGNIDFDGERTLFIGNSGTSIRFLTALMLILQKGQVTLTGVERMKQRPIGHLISALRSCGVDISAEKNNCYPPIKVQGTQTKKLNELFLDCSVSSQYLTGILMVAPSFISGLKVNILNNLVSSKFIEMTIKIMNKFGLKVDWVNADVSQFFVIKHQKYKNPNVYNIEADASSCSYPIAYSIINKIPLHIPNLTSNNTQGDLFYSTEVMSKFGKFVLTCDESGTKIYDYDGELKGIGTIDMDSSDTFLTVGVLAALSEGTTKIINIDNQNVKECERINVLYEHLKEAGVDVKLNNLKLEINGKSKPNLNNLYVKCHHDHRIAMSLSLLNCHMNKLAISDHTCVNKTYPDFWNDMSKLGFITKPLINQFKTKIINHWNYIKKRPIIIVGMPCSGKSFFAKCLSKHYSLSCTDTDRQFETTYKISPEEYVKKHGWDKFREAEFNILYNALKSTNEVISTGGGIIEFQPSRTLLEQFKENTNAIILYIDIDSDIIKQRYMKRSQKAPYNMTIEELYIHRKKYYEQVSNYKYICGKTRIHDELQLFHKFYRRIQEKREVTPNSFFVCIPFDQIQTNMENLRGMTATADALELRIDYCYDIENSLDYIEKITSEVQRLVDVPLIATVRSRKEWGHFCGSNELLQKLINLFIKLGVSYIDHELSSSLIIKERKHVNIIGSCHTKDFEILKQNVMNGLKTHKPDILKVVVSKDIYKQTAEFLSKFDITKIFIAVGKEGSITRVQNRYLTPVTSDLVEATAPGQLTYKQISTVRDIINQKEGEFYLFGTPIRKSPSPFIHNYVFNELSDERWIYHRYETRFIENVVDIIQRPNFKGASVTMPLKESVCAYMDFLSEHVKKIGALNTIIRTDDGVLIGDNTDWLAIRDAIGQFGKKFKVAHVIGNGGTAKAACYTLLKLNIPCIVHCRNEAKASSNLHNMKIQKYIESMILNHDCELVINCVPPKVKINYQKLRSGTCIINMGYLKNNDKLIDRDDLNVIEGFVILATQAYYQFTLWSGRNQRKYRELYNKAINLC